MRMSGIERMDMGMWGGGGENMGGPTRLCGEGRPSVGMGTHEFGEESEQLC